jgi:hypothetical protein
MAVFLGFFSMKAEHKIGGGDISCCQMDGDPDLSILTSCKVSYECMVDYFVV